jgi:hypothetical protein
VYAYVNNEPLRLVDRKGLAPSCAQNCCNSAPAPAKAQGGTVMCCHGQKTVCLFNQYTDPQPGAGIISACKKKHEEKHFEDVQCDGTSNYQPNFKSTRPQAMGECEAYQAEISCLKASAPMCAGNAQCLDWTRRAVESLHANAQERGFGCVFR